MNRTGRPATAADVAAHAGVSRATVSHILNGRIERFPQATRERVRASAAALDYRPSPAGRSLVTGRGDTIVLLMPNTTMESNIQDAVDWISRTTAHVGSNVVLRFADADPDSTVTAILRMRPLGVVDFGFLSPAARHRLAGQGVPVVPHGDQPVGYQDPVDPDPADPDEVIARLQTAELVRRDRRRVVYAGIADSRADAFGPRRFAALQRACASRGLPEPAYLHVPLDAAGAAAVLRPWWNAEPLGVAAYNDVVAISVLSAAVDSGIDVPGHVSVVGNDHTAVGQLWRPRLSTIRVDVRAVVDHAIEQLMIALELPPSPVRVEDEREIELIRGETT